MSLKVEIFSNLNLSLAEIEAHLESVRNRKREYTVALQQLRKGKNTLVKMEKKLLAARRRAQLEGDSDESQEVPQEAGGD